MSECKEAIDLWPIAWAVTAICITVYELKKFERTTDKPKQGKEG